MNLLQHLDGITTTQVVIAVAAAALVARVAIRFWVRVDRTGR